MVISLGNQYEIRMRNQLRSASSEDLYRAAEALADAAICIQEDDTGDQLPSRQQLINALLTDPSQTLEILNGKAVH